MRISKKYSTFECFSGPRVSSLAVGTKNGDNRFVIYCGRNLFRNQGGDVNVASPDEESPYMRYGTES